MNFAGTMAKQGQKPFSASMSAFGAALLRGRVLAAAAMVAMAAALVKMPEKAVAAATAAMGAAILRGRLLAASTATMAATTTRQTNRVLPAVMSTFSVVFSTAHKILTSFAASMATFTVSVAKRVRKFFSAS